jgi:cytochrome c
MKSKPGNWTLEEIDHFVANPKGFIPGTTMSFAGVPRATERADLLAYLNTVTDNPAPLPKAADAAPAGGAPAPSAAAPAPKQ